MTSSLDFTYHNLKWPRDAEIIPFHEIPVNPELYILGEDQVPTLHAEWEAYLALPDGSDGRHPDESLMPYTCAVAASDELYYDLEISFEGINRYHNSIVRLPKQHFACCVYYSNFSKRPYLIVTNEWYARLSTTAFSSYALIDAIGVKSLLATEGSLATSKLSRLKSGIDQIAQENPNTHFFSYADSVIIKQDFSFTLAEYGTAYRPENFLLIVQSIRDAYLNYLGTDSYAIVTQGANMFFHDSNAENTVVSNHFFLGSLGAPFSELYDIDGAVKPLEPKKEFYLAKWFFLTLHFNDHNGKDSKGELMATMVPFKAGIHRKSKSEFVPVNKEELFSVLRF